MSIAGDKLRRSELAKIHIAKEQLGLDDETYRQMLWTIARVQSAGKLDAAGRRAVLEHLKARGFSGHKGKPKKAYAGGVNLMEKIEAQLADMQLPWSYALGLAKQMFKRDALEFCKPFELDKIVVALDYEQKKRQRLDHLKELLRELGLQESDIDTQVLTQHPNYKKDWRRDNYMLISIARWLQEQRNAAD
jgi:phage gp16-like protein